MFTHVRINRASALPLYAQIREHLSQLIADRALPPGGRLPTEGELCRIYGVSRLTVRQAIAELVTLGLVHRQHGVGTFVAQPKMDMAYTMALSFTQRMHLRGRQASSVVLAQETLPAPPDVAARLALEPPARALRLARVRLADGEPVLVETAWLSADRFPDAATQDFRFQSLYHFLAVRYQVTIAASSQSLEAVSLDKETARHLGVEPGSPAMRITVLAYDADKRPVETSQAFARGDVSRYVFHLTNGPAAATP